MSFLLCIDTSIRGVGACLVDLEDGGAQSSAWSGVHLDVMSSASQISEIVKRGLAEIKGKPDDISGVAVSVGPGSFTGIKIGLAFASGFTLERRKDCGLLGLSSLESSLAQHLSKSSDAEGALFLPATRTHGFVSWTNDGGGSLLVDMRPGEDGEKIVRSCKGWIRVIGEWPALEDSPSWNSVGGKSLPLQEAATLSLEGMRSRALKAFPDSFGINMPEPRYLRLTTAEENKLAKE